jgi:hypothetical protein
MFECWGRSIGLGNAWTVKLNDKGKPKPMKLDGCHVKKLLEEDKWREGVIALDKREGPLRVWEVNIL